MCIFLNKKKKRAIAKWWIEQNRARVGESFFEHENGTSVCMRERENGAGTGGAKGGWGAPTPLTPPKIF